MSLPHDVEVRLSRLEAENHRLRRLVGVAGFCAIALPVLAAFAPFRPAVPEELKAERFVLVDGAGKTRAELTVEKGTTPQLAFNDPEGKPRLTLAVDPQTAYVILKDDQGKNRLGLAVDAFPHLMLHDGEQRPRLHASVGISGAPSLLFSDGKQFALGMGIDASGKTWKKPEIDEAMRAAAGKEDGGHKPIDPPAEPGVEPKKKDG